MNKSAKRKVFTGVIILFILCILGLGFLYYFPISGGRLSLVNADWGEYSDMYRYKKEESIKLGERSFLVDVYVVNREVVIWEAEEYPKSDIIVYNRDILDNLRTEIQILTVANKEIQIEDGLNYELTLSKGIDGHVDIEATVIDVSDKREEYIWTLFEIMKVKQNILLKNDLQDLGFSVAEIIEFKKRAKDEESYKVDALSIVVAQRLLEVGSLSDERKLEVEEYLNENQEDYELKDTLFPCYVSKNLETPYIPVVPSYTNPLNLEEATVEDLIKSLYYENALRPSGNDGLRLFVDRLNYCNEESLLKNIDELDKTIKYLYGFSNIDSETIILLKGVLRKLNNMGYTEVLEKSLEEYTMIEEYYNLSSVRLYVECIINQCSSEEIINKLPMSIKLEGTSQNIFDQYSSYDSYSEALPSIIILSIMNNEK